MADPKSGGKVGKGKSQDGEAPPAPVFPAGTDPEKWYDKFLPDAEAFQGASLPCRADLSVAYHNANDGFNKLKEYASVVAAKMRDFDMAAAGRLPMIALAAMFAASRVDRCQGSTGVTGQLLARGAVLRELLLASLDALAKKAIVPARDVQKIHEGSGAIDLAKDCVAAAGLFRKHADAIGGMTPVTSEEVDEAAEVGGQLLTLLRPVGTPRVGTAKAARGGRYPRPLLDHAR